MLIVLMILGATHVTRAEFPDFITDRNKVTIFNALDHATHNMARGYGIVKVPNLARRNAPDFHTVAVQKNPEVAKPEVAKKDVLHSQQKEEKWLSNEQIADLLFEAIRADNMATPTSVSNFTPTVYGEQLAELEKLRREEPRKISIVDEVD